MRSSRPSRAALFRDDLLSGCFLHSIVLSGSGGGSGQLLAGISTELVQLHHRVLGKGPTKAKSFFIEDTMGELAPFRPLARDALQSPTHLR